MRFNDILNEINKVIEALRVTRELYIKGHLVSTMQIHKSMGPYKQFYLYIDYIDTDNNQSYRLLTNSLMAKAPSDKLEEIKIELEKSSLFKLITLLHDSNVWESIIEGKYGTK